MSMYVSEGYTKREKGAKSADQAENIGMPGGCRDFEMWRGGPIDGRFTITPHTDGNQCD